MRANDALAGGFSIGDRIQGPRTQGTVTGPPSRVALKAVAVKVLWDDGNVSDERINVLTALGPANKPKPARAKAAGGYPQATGGYPAQALANGRGQASPTRPQTSPKAASPPPSKRAASPGSPVSRMPQGASPHSASAPRLPSSQSTNGFSFVNGGSSSSSAANAALSPNRRQLSPAAAVARGAVGGAGTPTGRGGASSSPAPVNGARALARGVSPPAGVRGVEPGGGGQLPGGWRPGEEVLSLRGALGVVVGPASRQTLRAVAVSVNWGRGYSAGNITDERATSLRPASPSSPATPSLAARVVGLPAEALKAAALPEQQPRQPRRSHGHTPGGYSTTTSSGSPATVSAGWASDATSSAAGSPGAASTPGSASQRKFDLRRTDTPLGAAGGGATPVPEGNGASGGPTPLPDVSRPVRRRSSLDARDPDGPPNPIDLLRRHSLRMGYEHDPVEATRERRRQDSSVGFADRLQTVIVFDWDDTLFPTSWILDDAGLDWTLPLSRQRAVRGFKREAVAEKLAICEDHAVGILQRANQCGHVVLVTLAAAGWVEKACRQFYRRVGDLLEMLRISVVYAQGPHTKRDLIMQKSKGVTDEEFWGLLKGRAISEEVAKFYSRYEGQTWKNVLSIGDSRFERYGLLAATTAYMQGQGLHTWNRQQPYSPTQRNVWEKVSDDERVVRLRAKCVKLVDRPDVEELTIELSMVSRWLMSMVQLDEGFDLDLDNIRDEPQVVLVEAVLAGKQPVSALP